MSFGTWSHTAGKDGQEDSAVEKAKSGKYHVVKDGVLLGWSTDLEAARKHAKNCGGEVVETKRGKK